MRAMPLPAKVDHRVESMGSTVRNRMRGTFIQGPLNGPSFIRTIIMGL